MMLTTLDVCTSDADVTYADQRKLQFDRASYDEPSAPNGRTDHSLASRFFNGEVALDERLLLSLGSKPFFHVATVFALQAAAAHECRGFCCGASGSIRGDVGVCAAFILFRLCEASDQPLAQIGGIAAVAPFLRACETRVAMYATLPSVSASCPSSSLPLSCPQPGREARAPAAEARGPRQVRSASARHERGLHRPRRRRRPQQRLLPCASATERQLPCLSRWPPEESVSTGSCSFLDQSKRSPS